MDEEFLSADSTVDLNTQTILLHASNHDLAALKPLLRIPGNASVQDPETGYTPLHAAIAACGPAKSNPNSSAKTMNGAGNEGQSTTTSAGEENKEVINGKDMNGKAEEDEEEYGDPTKAAEVVKELFLSGAIWNDLSSENETPGCLAYRLGHMNLYNLCVEAGVRAELLLAIMGAYEPLESSDSEEEEEETVENMEGVETTTNGQETTNGSSVEQKETKQDPTKPDVNSEDYLKSNLTFTDNALLDSDQNGVMMSWETSIMRKSVDTLLSSPSSPSTLLFNKRILNIGFGMGIIDTMFAATKPLSHHIVEAHPAVLAKLAELDSKFGKVWEEAAPEGGSYKIHAGKWQDILPKLLEKGEVFDAIYFDTFGESYTQLKLFFDEFVPGLLDSGGKFGFFNGLGADRRISYDVYTKVVECHLEEAGMDVEWEEVEVPLEEMGMREEGKGEWEGVRRRYWTLERYRLPVCMFMG